MLQCDYIILLAEGSMHLLIILTYSCVAALTAMQHQ